MARRRRKKNPLLTRILIVSILAHAIGLPIAARFGAFDKLKKEFGDSRVVMINVPPDEEKKAIEKTAKKEHKTAPSAKKAASASSHNANAAKSNLPQPKMVAAAGGAGDGNGASVDANGTGKAGELPKDPNAGNGGGGAPTVEPPKVEPKTEPTPEPPKVEPKVDPVVTPKPEPPKVEPKPKKILSASIAFEPPRTDNDIPDDLRTEPLSKSMVIEAEVDANGKPTGFSVAQGTGIKELDEAGLVIAKKYRFAPATIDDVPVPGRVRFSIDFKVE